MAWNLEQAVIRGEIDNSVEGKTTGKIWFIGREIPITLELEGNCWRDLAGSKLTFSNPNPEEILEAEEIEELQLGSIGDVTASIRIRLPLVEESEFNQLVKESKNIPCRVKNLFYLEWFSEANGRVLIESSDFKLHTSPYQWSMSLEAEAQQKELNLLSMRQYVQEIIASSTWSKSTHQIDEFEWEERLRESDRVLEVYEDVMEKYVDDIQGEAKESFVMGWTSKVNGRTLIKNQTKPYITKKQLHQLIDDLEEVTWRDIDPKVQFPIEKQLHHFLLRILDSKSLSLVDARLAESVISYVIDMKHKLSQALHDKDPLVPPDSHYASAQLKRCLSLVNLILDAFHCLIKMAPTEPKKIISELRTELFFIREALYRTKKNL